MKLNSTPNLKTEDYGITEKEKWVTQLFFTLNPFFQSITDVLNENVDFTNNIKSVTKSYQITAYSEFSIQWPFKISPQDVRVISAQKGAKNNTVGAILLLAWTYNPSSKLITINRISEVLESSVQDIPTTTSDTQITYQFTIRASV